MKENPEDTMNGLLEAQADLYDTEAIQAVIREAKAAHYASEAEKESGIAPADPNEPQQGGEPPMTPEQAHEAFGMSLDEFDAQWQAEQQAEAEAEAEAKAAFDAENPIPDSSTVSPEEFAAAVQKKGGSMSGYQALAPAIKEGFSSARNALGGMFALVPALKKATDDAIEDLRSIGVNMEDYEVSQLSSVEGVKAAATSPLFAPVRDAQLVLDLASRLTPEVGDPDSVVFQMSKFLSGFLVTRGATARAGLGAVTAKMGEAVGKVGAGAASVAGSTAGVNAAVRMGQFTEALMTSNVNGAATAFWAAAADENMLDAFTAMGISPEEYFSYLRYDPEASNFENRLKNAMNDFALGAVADTTINVLRFFATGRATFESIEKAFAKAEVKKLRASGAAGKTAPEAMIGFDPSDFTAMEREAQARYARLTALFGEADGPVVYKGAEAGKRAAARARVTSPINLNPEDAARASEAIAGSPGTASVYRETMIDYNYSKIHTREDIHRVINEVAANFRDNADAVGPPRTLGAVRGEANQVDPVDIFLEIRQNGRAVTPLQDAEIVAMRDFHVATAELLRDTARLYQASPKDPAAYAAFNRTLTIFREIGAVIKGESAAASRRLGSFRVPASSRGHALVSQLDQLFESTGDDGAVRFVADAIDHAFNAGKLQSVADLVANVESTGALRKYVQGNTSKAVASLWYFSLLGRAGTQFRNSVGTGLHLGLKLAETEFAWLVGKALGTNETKAGEALAGLHGVMEGFRDALRLPHILEALNTPSTAADLGTINKKAMKEALDGGVYKAFREMQSGQYSAGKLNAEHTVGGFSSELWGYDPGSNFGRLMRTVDAVMSLPMRGIVATDEFYKNAFHRMEARQIAYRKANALEAAGKIDRAGWHTAYEEALANPTEAAKAVAERAAREGTFTQPLPTRGVGKSIAGAMSKLRGLPVVGKAIMPFQNTPYNIGWETLRRSPFAIAGAGDMWKEIGSGDPKRIEMAWSRFLLANMTLLTLVDSLVEFEDQIRVVGDPADPEGQRQAFRRLETRGRLGMDPRTLQISLDPRRGFEGDFITIPYSGMEPFIIPLAFAAQFTELIQSDSFDEDDPDMALLWAGVAMGLADQAMSTQMMTGAAGFFAALDDVNDPRKGMVRWMQDTATTLAAPGAISQFTAVQDEYYRTAFTTMDRYKARMPGLSETLPIRHDVWGRPMKRRVHGWGAMLGSSAWTIVTGESMEPVDHWLYARKELINAPSKTRATVRPNVEVMWKDHPAAFEEWKKITGQGITLPAEAYPAVAEAIQARVGGLRPPAGWQPVPGLSFLENVNLLVQDKHPIMNGTWQQLSDGTNGERVELIRQAHTYYKNVAMEILLSKPEFADLREEVQVKADQERMAVLPDLQAAQRLHIPRAYLNTEAPEQRATREQTLQRLNAGG